MSNQVIVFLNLFASTFTSIGKTTRSQDCNVAHHVLAKSIVCISTRQLCLLKCTSQIVPLHPNTLKNIQ